MLLKSTLKKIRAVELKYGSLINALEENKLKPTTYYRWKHIVLTPEYNKYIQENENKAPRKNNKRR